MGHPGMRTHLLVSGLFWVVYFEQRGGIIVLQEEQEAIYFSVDEADVADLAF